MTYYVGPGTGICECGCGGQTKQAGSGGRGVRKGEFHRFISGHQNGTRPQYVEAVPFKINGKPCRLLPLTDGYYAIIDAEDYDRVWNFKWYAAIKPCGVYASRNLSRVNNGPSKKEYLHRAIMGASPDPILTHIDHRNHVTLDCRKDNLRFCTQQQNKQNVRRHKYNRSGYRGVLLSRGTHIAKIRANGKILHLGSFKVGIDAARAYDRAAIKYHGEFAYLNFPREDYQGEATA